LIAEIAIVRKEGIAYDNEEYMTGLRWHGRADSGFPLENRGLQ